MRDIAKVVGFLSVVAALPITIVACSSNSTRPVTGTETFSGTEALTSAQASSSSFVPTIQLTANGLFSDTGSIYLAPGSGKDGNGPGNAVIKLKNGNINVTHAGTNPNQQPKNIGGCTYAVSEKVSYTVTSGTGSYSDIVSGHGTATVTFEFTLPKLLPVDPKSPGGCDMSNNAVPTSGSATFLATGPITRKS